MAQQPPPIHFEDIPLEQARTMGRGSRMAPELYHAFKGKIQSLDNTATRLTLPEGTSHTTMKNHLLRVGVELGIPLTIRRVPGGLVFWRSSDEDIQQAQEKTASRLQTARRRQIRPEGVGRGNSLSRPGPARRPPARKRLKPVTPVS